MQDFLHFVDGFLYVLHFLGSGWTKDKNLRTHINLLQTTWWHLKEESAYLLVLSLSFFILSPLAHEDNFLFQIQYRCRVSQRELMVSWSSKALAEGIEGRIWKSSYLHEDSDIMGGIWLYIFVIAKLMFTRDLVLENNVRRLTNWFCMKIDDCVNATWKIIAFSI